MIGTDAVAKSLLGGYTLLLMSNTHTVNESLIPSKPFALMRDFVPVAPINASDLVLVVKASLPVATPPELNQPQVANHGELYKPDLVLMPIGGGQFVMNPAVAAFAARELIKARAVIPMHCGTNPALPGTPAEFIQALGGNSAVKLMVMQPGDTLEF